MEGGYKLNITKAIVVAIYIIVGAALGVIIIPEVVKDLGIHHHAVITNYYVDSFIGIIIFFIIQYFLVLVHSFYYNYIIEM